jgi:hypothetical protein
MSLQLVASSAVAAAQHFNPSVTGQHWLIEKGIIRPEEIQVGSVFTDVVAQVPTQKFQLLVIQENCQITFPPQGDAAEQQALLKERLGRLVELLPHTPYTAVALNFLWHVFPGNETMPSMSRRLFFASSIPLCRAFDREDARFGVYASMDWKGYRLKVGANPVLICPPGGQSSEAVQFSFNYHRQVLGRPEAWRDVVASFDLWQEAKEYAVSILCEATGEQLK